MNFHNPFENSEIAAAYEGWYFIKGKKAAVSEKAQLKSIARVFPDNCSSYSSRP